MNVPPRISTFPSNTFEERSHAIPASKTINYEICLKLKGAGSSISFHAHVVGRGMIGL
jgi:hypothetical protein